MKTGIGPFRKYLRLNLPPPLGSGPPQAQQVISLLTVSRPYHGRDDVVYLPDLQCTLLGSPARLFGVILRHGSIPRPAMLSQVPLHLS